MDKKFDFSGWATKANLLCSDGRVITADAFKHMDGATVPIVWNHAHGSVLEILGKATLEHRDDGIYAYGAFNDTEAGQAAKVVVQHGDVTHLSIYANKLKHNGRNVVHGMIREVSLVMAGANPGAVIDSVMMHGDDSEEEGYIYTDSTLENVEPLFHADKEDDKTEEKGEKEMAEETKKTEAAEGGKTVKEIFDTLNPEQKDAVYYVIGRMTEGASAKKTEDSKDSEKEEVKHSEEIEGGETEMTHLFEGNKTNQEDVLMHFDMEEITKIAKRQNGSLKEAFNTYAEDNALQHGIDNLDILFPEATNLNKTPEFIKRDTGWVGEVMHGVHHTPFSRIKSVFADITEAEARAKGYIKGTMKKDEFFKLLKRVTTPTTIYKKQSFDRDDIIDITEFDVVAWVKGEMRMMLDEEIARAILVGDGRPASSEDKINEQNLRPIWTDDDLYTVKKAITVAADADKAKEFIKAVIRSRKEYKGSGNPVMFMTEDMLTECLLIEDTNQRMIYENEAQLANKLRVKKIVTVPVMENLTRQVGEKKHELAAIYVNLADYNVGADKGGAVNMFDDFDIDYNRYKYLIETRCSGALTKPYAAVALEFVQA
jgi:hypothetical protein